MSFSRMPLTHLFHAFRSAIAFALSIAIVTVIATDTAQACACCSQTAWRRVEVEKLSPRHVDEISQLRFAKNAKLMLGEADEDGIKGVIDPPEDYNLAVTRSKDRWAFAFRDKTGRAGTLALALPKTISIFEVDPRHGADEGQGPILYKEWKLTANAAGDGFFKASLGAGQKITLVLHGRGNGCTSADQFTHWTLLVHGPVDTYTMYGALLSDGQ
jgi:hypothetical protein